MISCEVDGVNTMDMNMINMNVECNECNMINEILVNEYDLL